MGRNVGFYSLGKRERDLRAVLRRTQQQLVVGVADVTGLEQHRGRSGSAKHVECREAMRVGTKLEPAG